MQTGKKILIIDDEEEMLRLTSTILSDNGYECITSKGGDEGIRAAISNQPDLIICDLNMPRMNGIDTCHILRRIPATGTTPIIMLTVIGDQLSQLRGFQEGRINDYIVKPFIPSLLLARVSAHLSHTEALRKEYDRINEELKNKIDELQKHLGEVVQDVEEARRRLPNIIPQIPQIDGFDINAIYRPCQRIGGDFYEIISLSKKNMAFFIGELQEHGIQAAVLQGIIRKSLRNLVKNFTSPKECMLAINGEMFKEFGGRTFLSLFYGILDLESKDVSFCRGGHTPPLLYSHSRDGRTVYLETPGTVLGISSNEVFSQTLVERKVKLLPGDILLLYTEGLSECKNPNGLSYGMDRVISNLTSKATLHSDSIIQAIEEDLKQFRGEGVIPQEDLTLFCIKLV